MKQKKSLILIGFFIVFFLAGHIVGRSLGYSNNYRNPNMSSINPDSQSIFLIIGTDHLNSQSPNIESVWLALFIHNHPSISFVPIYPPSNVSMPLPQELLKANLPQLSSKHLDKSIANSLNQSGIFWDNYVIIDSQGWSEINHTIKGEYPGRNIFEITNSDLSLSNVEADPNVVLTKQAYRFQQLCNNLKSQPNIIDPSSLINTEHISTDLTGNELSKNLSMIQAQAQTLMCKFPTMSN